MNKISITKSITKINNDRDVENTFKIIINRDTDDYKNQAKRWKIQRRKHNTVNKWMEIPSAYKR